MDPALFLLIPVFLFSLTIHEAAHALAAKWGGDMTATYLNRLSLNPLVHIDPLGTIILPALMVLIGLPPFGWAKPVPVDTLKLRSPAWLVYVALAGPASNILIFVATLLLMKCALILGLTPPMGMGNESALTASLWSLGVYSLQINLVLALFNLLPIPPLDGSRVLFHLVIRHHRQLLPIWAALEGFAGILLVYLALSISGVRLGFMALLSFILDGAVKFLH